MQTVVVAILGSQLDRGSGEGRWSRWRPTVSICQHEDLVVDRLELAVQPADAALAETVIEDIRAVSPETEIRPHALELRDAWDFEEVYGALYGWARQLDLDPSSSDVLVGITTGSHVQQICLFLLTESRHFPGRLLQCSPPRRKSPDALGRLTTIDLDLSRYDRIARRFIEEQEESLEFLKSGIATRNAPFNALIEKIEKVAIRSRDPILLMGPTGAGKSQLARRIHELKVTRHRIDGHFVEVNCATIRGDAAMSALFGHVSGAFTGASRDRAGLLRTANRGVLFLDEIGELGLDEQAMLLRAIEEKRFLPVGADREDESDFQLIAGTHRDLGDEVRKGRFREDLLARIDLWTFRLPALADRREDIEPNLDYELSQFSRRTGRRLSFNREARELFLEFATKRSSTWSGNFRDLNAAINRMGTLASGGRVSADVVREEIARLREGWRRGPAPDRTADSVLRRVLTADEIDALDRFDRVQLAEVLRVCGSTESLSAAGRELFSVSRLKKQSSNDADRLRKYLARFGLDWKRAHSTSH
ncbi:MAG: RNA repair transcriptional activator RtcR [Planctomycetes bacterium]|nr:RNA repair transcriptional activator RtcR [Planctomycetota bacterium]